MEGRAIHLLFKCGYEGNKIVRAQLLVLTVDNQSKCTHNMAAVFPHIRVAK